MIESIKKALAESAGNHMGEVVGGLIASVSTIVLIGGTISIILYVAGWERGMRWTGVMFVGYVILRTVLGVV